MPGYEYKLHDDAHNQWDQTFINGIIVSKAGMPYMQLKFVTVYTQSLNTSMHRGCFVRLANSHTAGVNITDEGAVLSNSFIVMCTICCSQHRLHMLQQVYSVVRGVVC